MISTCYLKDEVLAGSVGRPQYRWKFRNHVTGGEKDKARAHPNLVSGIATFKLIPLQRFPLKSLLVTVTVPFLKPTVAKWVGGQKFCSSATGAKGYCKPMRNEPSHRGTIFEDYDRRRP